MLVRLGLVTQRLEKSLLHFWLQSSSVMGHTRQVSLEVFGKISILAGNTCLPRAVCQVVTTQNFLVGEVTGLDFFN